MMRNRLLLGVVLVCFLIGVSSQSMSVLGNRMDSASSVASPEAVSCTVWAQDGGYGVDSPGDYPRECTLSQPWWNAWANCDITPVHAELFDYPRPWDQQLKGIPWIIAESNQVELIGHLFYGNRPLIAGGVFGRDGTNAKLLWQFGERVELKSISGANLWNPGETAEIAFSVANSNNEYSFEFPSMMDFPTGGCWETTLAGNTESGAEFTATATFIVIDN